MRIGFIFHIVLIAFFTIVMAKADAQSFGGVVKNEQGLIVIRTPENATPEIIAAAWRIPLQQLLGANPALLAGQNIETTNLFVPIVSILQAKACANCVPVYHKVQQSEGLFRIGRWYGNIPTSALKERNNLRNDNLKPGQQLLIGYIELPTGGMVTVEEKAEMEMPSFAPVVADSVTKKATVYNNAEVPDLPVVNHELTYAGMGIFEKDFEKAEALGAKKITGRAASFKSESGWKDGRFYVLSSQLKAGVVVKLFHQKTGKVLYAKVVGPLPNIKQNDGLDWRLNNAAAAAFGIWEENAVFEVEMEY